MNNKCINSKKKKFFFGGIKVELLLMWIGMPLTASNLSQLPELKTCMVGRGACEEVTSEWGLGGGFRRVLLFPLDTTYNWLVTT